MSEGLVRNAIEKSNATYVADAEEPRFSSLALIFDNIRQLSFDPRTDGGLGHLSTDGGRITATPKYRKRSNLETSGKRLGYRLTSSTIFTGVIFRPGEK